MTEITYFCEVNKSPVKDYLDSLVAKAEELEEKGKTNQADKLRKNALRLFALIQHAAEHNGIVHPPQGDKMHGHPFFELRQKISKNLIRIFYFVYRNQKLVLLHVYQKPEGSPASQKEIATAQENYDKYTSNPKKHEL
jgi:phage-related protein